MAVRTPAPNTTPADQKADNSEGKQTKRRFGVVPNFAAVSADPELPALTVRGKFKLATQDSVDYSSFVWAGMLAGQSMALKSYPEFRNGIAGYGRYYWRAVADQASGSFFTEALVPAITHEDPRYHTLGHGGFFSTELGMHYPVSSLPRPIREAAALTTPRLWEMAWKRGWLTFITHQRSGACAIRR